jgi:hypothetical protein
LENVGSDGLKGSGIQVAGKGTVEIESAGRKAKEYILGGGD